MCTVSVLSTPQSRFRLVCNRDESRSRPIENPPSLIKCGDRLSIMPTDPKSGGSWVGVNDAGLVATLLNLNPQGSAPLNRPATRGQVVPLSLSRADTVSSRELILESLDPLHMGRFRLIVLDSQNVVEIISDGSRFHSSIRPRPEAAMVFTSSSLGDEVVAPQRLRAFKKLHPFDEANQDAFHQYRCPNNSAMGVMMSRADARTTSRTTIDFKEEQATLSHLIFHEHAAEGVTTRLTLSLAYSLGGWT